MKKKVHLKNFLAINPPRNSFGATQYHRSASHSNGMANIPLDREKSSREVDRLLEVRRQKMKQARNLGDDAEVHRLQTLGLFENVCEDVLDESSLVGGKTSCGVRFVEAEADSGSNDASTIRASSFLPAQSSVASVASIVVETACTTLAKYPKEDCDVFLELASEAPCRSDPEAAKASRRSKSCGSPSCKRGDACARYVRGRGCCLPKPQPSILAAKERIVERIRLPITMGLVQDLQLQADCKDGVSHPAPQEIEEVSERIDRACQSPVIMQLELDMDLVDMYDSSMELRCSKGVWWEGWLVVEELKSQGIVGSVYAVEE